MATTENLCFLLTNKISRYFILYSRLNLLHERKYNALPPPTDRIYGLKLDILFNPAKKKRFKCLR